MRMSADMAGKTCTPNFEIAAELAMQAESPNTSACVQMEPKIGDKKANVAHSLDKIAEAAGKGARLIVLPELCNSGYVFASRHEAFTLAEPVPDGPTLRSGWKRPAGTAPCSFPVSASERAVRSTIAPRSSGLTASSAPIERCIYGARRICSSNPEISG